MKTYRRWRKHHMGEKGKREDTVHLEQWEQEAEKVLKGRKMSSLMKHTYEGITLKPLYMDKSKRQIVPNSQTAWKISQQIQVEAADQAANKIQRAKERGQDSFYFSDFSFIEHCSDVKAIVKSLNFSEDKLIINMGAQLGFLPLFIASIAEREVGKLDGTVGFDPFESFLVNGNDNISLSTRFNYLKEAVEWGEQYAPNLRFIYINGTLYHDAGANAVQELVYTFSNAIDTVNELLNRGLAIDTIVRKITFAFSIGSNYFMEIAKFRAAKQIWASIVHALDGSEEGQKINVHAVTSLFNKAAYDVHVNLLRTTTEAFSAIIGGVNHLTITPFDHMLEESSELGERVARNIHFILKEESLLAKVKDPAGGSHYIEALTAELAKEAWDQIKQLDSNGGFKKALANGTVQNELKLMMEERIDKINTGKSEIIGTNAFANIKDEIHMKKNKEKTEKVIPLKDENTSFKELLNLAEKGKTLKQLTSLLYSKESLFCIKPLERKRLTEHFESLRQQAEKYRNKTGYLPKINVIVIGELKDYKPRLDFLSNFFAAGGFELTVTDISELEQLKNIKTAVLCGTDDDYKNLSNIKEQLGVKHLYIAGKQSSELLSAYGIDECIYYGMNMYKFLKEFHLKIGGEGK